MLTAPDVALLRLLDENRCFQRSMDVSDSNLKITDVIFHTYILIRIGFVNAIIQKLHVCIRKFTHMKIELKKFMWCLSYLSVGLTNVIKWFKLTDRQSYFRVHDITMEY